MRYPISLFAILMATAFCQAQKAETFKFKDVTLADVQKRIYSIDSSANAVVLGDIGSTVIDKDGVHITRHRRVHILKTAAYDEATFQIPVYGEGPFADKIEELKAVTYNADNGKLVEIKMSKDNMFTEKTTDGMQVRKFTLPGVKQGSIIDVKYRIESLSYGYIDPWQFQGLNPTIWSEFTFSVSDDLDYSFVKRGFHPLAVYDRKVGGGQTVHYWVMKDVPAMKQENFISSFRNFISMMEFHLTGIKFRAMDTWTDLAKALLSSPSFGEDITRNNNWLKEYVQPLIDNVSDPVEKSRKIFDYVRDNINCTSHSGLFLSQSLKDVLKTKKGNVSDVNLLLAAMLNYAGIQTTPVMLSTKSNGYVSTTYPMTSRFNYVILSANIAGSRYFMDASYRRLGFGRLLPECYNGQARVINESAPAIEFVADSLKEREVSYIALTDAKGKWTGRMQKMPSYFESYKLRNKIEDKGLEVFSKELFKDYALEETEFSNLQIDSLKKYEHPLLMRYELSVDNNSDVIYVNPMFGEGYKENPFKSDIRLCPIEMPYAVDKTHIASIEIPEGYVVDELPKSVRVKLNDADDGGFEYIINTSGNTVSLNTRLYLKKATFLPSQYEDLREFFNFVVGKQKEQIVFKKKN